MQAFCEKEKFAFFFCKMPVAGHSGFCHILPKHKVRVFGEQKEKKSIEKQHSAKSAQKDKKSFTKRHGTSEREGKSTSGLFSENNMNPIIPGVCKPSASDDT